MNLYRSFSLGMSIVFAGVGVIFLSIPEDVILFFNGMSDIIGLPESPAAAVDFYLVLASSYMYVVSVLAFMMFRHPANRYFPLLLANSKLASSAVSVGFFMFKSHYLIYAANFFVDGIIGGIVLILYLRVAATSK